MDTGKSQHGLSFVFKLILPCLCCSMAEYYHQLPTFSTIGVNTVEKDGEHARTLFQYASDRLYLESGTMLALDIQEKYGNG